MLHLFTTLIALLVCCNARLQHFALVFRGECIQSSPTQALCQGTANSQTIAAYIDPTEGVTFTDTQQTEGPVAVLTLTVVENPKSIQEYGTIQFGYDPNTQMQTILQFQTNQNDFTYIADKTGDHAINAGFYNITGGSGGYAMAHGLISVNAQVSFNSQSGVSDWYAFLEAAIGTPN